MPDHHPTASVTASEWGFLDGIRAFPGIRSAEYEFSADRAMLEALGTLTPFTALARALMRLQLSAMRGTQLGTAVRVGPRQFPNLHEALVRAAAALDLRPPELFVSNNPNPNAWTVGVDQEDVTVMLTSGLVDLLEPRELMFVVGHELGHIKSNHTLFHTIGWAMTRGLLGTVPLVNILGPLSLMAWERRSEITCDRAGLLCAQDVHAATGAMLKTALGSRKLVDQVNLDEFIAQVRDLRGTVGGNIEIFQSHPFLPKRVRALQLFNESKPYIERVTPAETSSLTLEDIDTMVHDLLFSSSDKGLRFGRGVQDEDVLSLLGVLAVIWSDATVSAGDREAFLGLLEDYGTNEEWTKTLTASCDEKVDLGELEILLRSFAGERENVFFTALEFVMEQDKAVSRRRRNALFRLGEMCGMDSTRVMTLVHKRTH